MSKAFETGVYFRPIAATAEIETTGRDKDENDFIIQAAKRALNRYFNPLTGGPTADGWPFGRPVHPGEAHRILQRVPGVHRVRMVTVSFFRAATDRVTWVVSAEHRGGLKALVLFASA